MPRKTGNKTENKTKSCSNKNAAKKKADKTENESSFPAVKKQKLHNENVGNKENIRFLKRNYRPCNIYKYYQNHEMGLPCEQFKKPLKDLIINYIKTFKLYKVESPFDRRVTFIVWSPVNPRVLAVTSHGGDVLLYNYEQDMSSASMIKGIGAGGSVQSMKFDPFDPVQIYSVSMEGKFLILNFHTKQARQFLETNNKNRWYISVDVNSVNNLMVAGDTVGSITVLTLQGGIIDTVQIHKKGFKVSHAEFSKREPWLLCTSSTDSSVKLWDVRNIKSDPAGLAVPLQKIEHQKPINAAYFNLTDGCRLLTTDQMDEINIYRAPLWNLETVIKHPHRQYQHLTPIKAYWHPFEDIVFVGRYPHNRFPGYHENELRTLDFFDAETGDLLYQHHESSLNGIFSLNRFNITGDALASSYGSRFLVWKPDFRHLERVSKNQDRLERNKKSLNGLHKGNDSGDDDDNDDSDSDAIDWGAIIKQQLKDKKKVKRKH